MSSKTDKTVEWTKELLEGIGEFIQFSLDPIAMLHHGLVTNMGYRTWKDKREFFEHLKERRKVLSSRKESFIKISRAIADLERRKVIAINKTKGTFGIALLPKGVMKLLRSLAPKRTKQKVWDGKWRIVVFDIPEKYKPTREMLRRYLYELGFSQIQKSVFAAKEPRLSDVRRLMRACEMEPFTQYFVATEWNPSNEDQYE